MEVATQHSEAVSQRAGVSVEERLFLYGIALHAAHVAPRHVESSAAVVTDLADARLTIGDRAAVAAGVTAHTVAVELLIQLAFADMFVNNVAQCGHRKPPLYSKPGRSVASRKISKRCSQLRQRGGRRWGC